ncbi:hypothetical protein DEO61_24820 [Escherichia coli]|nr:hypothetical protein DEO61_24820 [Escherichia coli]RXE87966.1 hypothetical protein EG871_13865 [Enterococcus faecium]
MTALVPGSLPRRAEGVGAGFALYPLTRARSAAGGAGAALSEGSGCSSRWPRGHAGGRSCVGGEERGGLAAVEEGEEAASGAAR